MPVFLFILAAILVASTINGLSSLFGEITEGAPPVSYTLTMNMDGYGTITGYGAYEEGEMAFVRATPDRKWEFVEWTGDTDNMNDRFRNSTTILVDADYHVTANFKLRDITPHTVSNIVLRPEWPATLYYGEWIKINFDYTVEYLHESESGSDVDIVPDAHILARPFSNGALSPGYLVRGYNFLRPWDHEGEAEFTITSQRGRVVVDQIRFQITSADKTIIFHEFFVPVIYTFERDESLDLEE
jgi:hypothetical protein